MQKRQVTNRAHKQYPCNNEICGEYLKIRSYFALVPNVINIAVGYPTEPGGIAPINLNSLNTGRLFRLAAAIIFTIWKRKMPFWYSYACVRTLSLGLTRLTISVTGTDNLFKSKEDSAIENYEKCISIVTNIWLTDCGFVRGSME